MTGAQRKAVVIGISEYTSLQRLDFCKNDGTEVYEVLSSLGYEISDGNKLVGEAKGDRVRDAIYDFFDDKRVHPEDTLLFYYSGHGVLVDDDSDIFLASSDTDSYIPYRRGFSFEELTRRMENTIATRVVVILDCCYSLESEFISKGSEQHALEMQASMIIDEKSKKLEGRTRYILAASQGVQEPYTFLTTGEHSIFTYYLLQGLKGNTESIDSEGNVTAQSLSEYVYKAIMSLPARPHVKPITRAEGSANIILASYPEKISTSTSINAHS